MVMHTRNRPEQTEWIRLQTHGDRYVIIADAAVDYCTLKEDDAAANHQGELDIYRQYANPLNNEHRMAIRSHSRLGAVLAVQRLIFDPSLRLDEFSCGVAITDAGSPQAFSEYAILQVRAITGPTDMDLSTLTWNTAYGGGSPLTFDGNVATVRIAQVEGTITCTPTPPYPASAAWSSNQSSDETLLMSFRNVPDPWNAATILGFEFRWQEPGVSGTKLHASGSNLDDPQSICFAITGSRP